MKTFTGEHEYLLHLLSSVITCTQPCEKPEALSFQRIFDIAADHSVANTAFYAIEKLSVKPDEAPSAPKKEAKKGFFLRFMKK